MTMLNSNDSKYIVLISVHGLIRAHDLELGRDADTGGQTKYVVDVAKALAEHDDVAQVDLGPRNGCTGQILDSQRLVSFTGSEQC